MKKKSVKTYNIQNPFNVAIISVIYIFSIVGIYISQNVIIDVFYFLLVPIFAIFLVKGDLIHPYVWFSLIFSLYSISHPVLIFFNATYDVYVYTDSLLILQLSSLTIILLIIGNKKNNYIISLNKISFEKRNLILFKILALLISMAIIEILLSGYSHKREIYSQGSIIVQIGFRAALVFIILYGINQIVNFVAYKRFDKKESLIFFSIMFLLVIFSGERDIFLRAVVVGIFIYYVFAIKQKLNLKIILLGIFSLLLIPLMKKFKYFGLSGEIDQNENNFIVEFFYSDFAAASKNFQMILLSDYEGYLSGQSYIWTFYRLVGLDNVWEVPSVISWYNNNFFEENRSGQGFSILAEGYVNFGLIGVISIAVFIGFLIKYLYKFSVKNIYFFVYYLLSIPVFMYALRADLANLILPLVTQNLIFLLGIIILNDFTRQAGLIKKKDS